MIVKEIFGKPRSFEFGTRTFVFLHELTGVKVIDEVFECLANKRKNTEPTTDPEKALSMDPIMSEIEHLDFISKFVFACAKTGAELSDEPIDFNEGKVSAWIDEIGLAASLEIMNTLIQTYTEKNLKAPIKGPQQKAA